MIYLVGVVHYRKESCHDVTDVIQKVQPDILFLELCEERRHLLRTEKNVPGEMAAAREASESVPNCTLILGDMPLSLHSTRLLNHLGDVYSDELVIMDLIRSNTVLRKYTAAPEGFRMDLSRFVEEKEPDWALEVTGQWDWNRPILKKNLFHDRDIYMTYCLQQLAKEIQPVDEAFHPTGRAPSVIVAVVGLGHLEGITELFPTAITEDQVRQVMNVNF